MQYLPPETCVRHYLPPAQTCSNRATHLVRVCHGVSSKPSKTVNILEKKQLMRTIFKLKLPEKVQGTVLQLFTSNFLSEILIFFQIPPNFKRILGFMIIIVTLIVENLV